MKKTAVFSLLFTMYCCVAVTAQSFSLSAFSHSRPRMNGPRNRSIKFCA